MPLSSILLVCFEISSFTFGDVLYGVDTIGLVWGSVTMRCVAPFTVPRGVLPKMWQNFLINCVKVEGKPRYLLRVPGTRRGIVNVFTNPKILISPNYINEVIQSFFRHIVTLIQSSFKVLSNHHPKILHPIIMHESSIQ